MKLTNATKVAEKIFTSPADISRFLESLTKNPEPDTGLIWMGERQNAFEDSSTPDFLPDFIQIVDKSTGPGRSPLHDQGAYYCLDVSSAFEASVLQGIPKQSENTHGTGPRVVVDLCASPGGKSIFAWRLLKPDLVISNEVIRPRAKVLISNLKRCGVRPSRVFSIETGLFAERFPRSADVVIVDAPCSGQSLIVKGTPNSGAFHSRSVKGNSRRQRWILDHASRILRPGGYLAYMTCTFSPEENEEQIENFLETHSDFESMPVGELEAYRSKLTKHAAYRLFPYDGLGTGGFTALLKNKKAGSDPASSKGLFESPCLWNAD